jgi:hypothetical protein
VLGNAEVSRASAFAYLSLQGSINEHQRTRCPGRMTEVMVKRIHDARIHL